MSDAMEMTIAASAIRGSIPKDKPLAERVAFAMRYAREHQRDVFWMSARTSEDMMMRTALAAVMLEGDEADKALITRSLQPLRMLSAAASGIPVDFSQLDTEGILPLASLWNDSTAKA